MCVLPDLCPCSSPDRVPACEAGGTGFDSRRGNRSHPTGRSTLTARDQAQARPERSAQGLVAQQEEHPLGMRKVARSSRAGSTPSLTTERGQAWKGTRFGSGQHAGSNPAVPTQSGHRTAADAGEIFSWSDNLVGDPKSSDPWALWRQELRIRGLSRAHPHVEGAEESS